MSGYSLSKKEEILLAVSISFGALFIATVVTLLVARFSKKIKEWCITYMPCCRETNEKDDFNENTAKCGSKVPLMLLATDEKEFIIPGSIVSERIQPEIFKSSRSQSIKSFRSQSMSRSEKQPNSKENLKLLKQSKSLETRHSVFAINQSDQQQKQKKHKKHKRNSVSLKDINPLLLRRNAFSKSESYINQLPTAGQIMPELYKSPVGSISDVSSKEYDDDDLSSFLPVRGFLPSTGSSPANSDDEGSVQLNPRGSLSLELRPELYDMTRKRSVGFGTLGKIKMSLQYLDHDRNKLELFLQYIEQLQLRPGTIGVQVEVILLPDRETVFKSKMHQATEQPIFEQSFVFERTSPIDSFNAKTIRFLVYTLHGQERREYGESNMTLVRSEIYGQIKTNNVLNINPPAQNTEVGDLLVDIFYTNADEFHALIRAIKFLATTSVDQMNALQVKAYIKKKRRKLGETMTTMVAVPSEKGTSVQLNLELQQKIPWNSFMEHSLHITVSGKHRILGKNIKIGRVILGDNAISKSDNMHWKAIMNSPGSQYNLWHVLHGC